ncbi:MAG: hemerythrin family protein [Deltaproteobacteria bacterium]|jgi:hemerythrin|nr:hemerythrin family protein [Deltaproteobacteria bacterium]
MLFTKNLETGVPKIDEQHKELFVQADKLRDMAHKERIPETVEFLKSYVIKHFSMEEALQKASQYPKAAFHHQLHVDFTKQFKELYDQYKASGEKISIVLNINTIVNNWLREHIMKHDKEFADYYIAKTANRRRDGKPVPAQAKGAQGFGAARRPQAPAAAGLARPAQAAAQKPSFLSGGRAALGAAGAGQKPSIFSGGKTGAGAAASPQRPSSLSGSRPGAAASPQRPSFLSGSKPGAGSGLARPAPAPVSRPEAGGIFSRFFKKP